MEKLLTDILSGNRRAFDALVARYGPELRKTVTFLLRKYQRANVGAEAEDVVNNLFLSLMESDFRKIRQFKGISSFSTYLRVIVTRQILDMMRRGKRERLESRDGMLAESPDKSPSLVENYEEKQQLLVLEKVVEQLDPSEQLLMKLVYKKDLPAGDIARIMNISLPVFYSRKSRILKKIKKLCQNLSIASSDYA